MRTTGPGMGTQAAGPGTRAPIAANRAIAERLDEVAAILEEQGANPYRVRAYRHAAAMLRGLREPVTGMLAQGGLEALERLPGVGTSLARAIRDIAVHGRLPMLERLRGESDPIALLMTVPGVGRVLADRLHHELGIDTLEELETAAHDGRLAHKARLGPKRLAGLRAALAQRLTRVRTPLTAPGRDEPAARELLDVDREYRTSAAAGVLRLIAPRRLNPKGEAWLPVLHTHRGERHYTALFSNTPRAHQMGKTRDWVVLYADAGQGERAYTVITSERGALEGRRIVRGREAECAAYYRSLASPRPST